MSRRPSSGPPRGGAGEPKRSQKASFRLKLPTCVSHPDVLFPRVSVRFCNTASSVFSGTWRSWRRRHFMWRPPSSWVFPCNGNDYTVIPPTTGTLKVYLIIYLINRSNIGLCAGGDFLSPRRDKDLETFGFIPRKSKGSHGSTSIFDHFRYY